MRSRKVSPGFEVMRTVDCTEENARFRRALRSVSARIRGDTGADSPVERGFVHEATLDHLAV